VSRSWSFGDGGTSNEANPSHTYTSAGTYDVTLTVTDEDGAGDTETRQVSVTDPAPPPNEAPTAAFNPPSCTAGEPCQFTDASSDSDGSVVAWSWDFGDQGSTSNLKDPSHTYSSSGTYTVKLWVQDDDSAESTEVEHQITVAPLADGT
jgi:PKD repeat protein